jgi:hypothetical protein
LPGLSGSAQAINETPTPIAVTIMHSLRMKTPWAGCYGSAQFLPWQRCQNKGGN